MNQTPSLLIKAAQLDKKPVDLLIRNGRFAAITPTADSRMSADHTINAAGLAIFSSFHDDHTSAAASFMRGLAAEQPLAVRKKQYLHPFEGNLTEDDIHQATLLTCLELIRCGVTSFVSNGWHWWGSARAVKEMGMKATLCATFNEFEDATVISQMKAQLRQLYDSTDDYDPNIHFAVSPVSGISEPSLRWLAAFTRDRNISVHMAVATTAAEVELCLRQYGCRPAFHLDSLGLCSPLLRAVYGTHLNDSELQLLAARGATLVHCPLVSMRTGEYGISLQRAGQAGVKVRVGGGGAAEGTLDMFTTLRTTLLAEKVMAGDPAVFTAGQALQLATEGRIEVGAAADCILVDLNHPRMIPDSDTAANLVYSADAACIDTTICNGIPLMLHHRIPDEERIIDRAQQSLQRIRHRAMN